MCVGFLFFSTQTIYVYHFVLNILTFIILLTTCTCIGIVVSYLKLTNVVFKTNLTSTAISDRSRYARAFLLEVLK